MKDGDVILIGHFIVPYLEDHGFRRYKVFMGKDKLFGWVFLKNKLNHRILFFGFAYSYWGNIIGEIAKGFYKDGANLIIHVANVGSCREPEDIRENGSSIFVPMFFSKIEDEKVIFADNLWNPLLEMCENYNSGIHTCVDSVMDEVYEPFRKIVTRMGITSVNTEAFHIVHAQRYCEGRRVGFSGIYYASDYLRKPREETLYLPYDLTSKTKQHELRQKMLLILTKLVAQYLQSLTTSPHA